MSIAPPLPKRNNVVLVNQGPNRAERRAAAAERKDESASVENVRLALANAAPVAAESVVRQTNYFPLFKDGGPHVGVLYTKTWRTVGVMGVTDEWKARVAGYWERLEKKYGVIWSRPVIDFDDETGCIVTAATPLVLIPGERYEVQG